MSHSTWFVDPTQMSSIEMLEDGIVCSTHGAGHYADLPNTEERSLLDFLASNPWREGLRQRLSGTPWLSAIITDERRPAAVMKSHLKPHAKILDVGSGWGQLSIPLAKAGHNVCALDQTPNRLRLLKAIARQEGVDCGLFCGDIESAPLRPAGFDLLILNGMLEWTPRGRPDNSDCETHQINVLRRCATLLATGGSIFIAIENALGLKYLMGSRDDHCGLSWVMLADEADAQTRWTTSGIDKIRARTHDLDGYRRVFSAAGLQEENAWACFPDYKLPSHVIPLAQVDDFLLGDSIWDEHHGDNGTPLPAEWPLRSTYRRLAQNGAGALVAPSYAFLLNRATNI